MAFGSRNSLLTLFLVVVAGLSVVAGAAAITLLVRLGGGAQVNFYEAHRFWFAYDIAPRGALVNAIGGLALCAAGLTAFAVFRIFFKRVGQAEVFFIALFLVSFIPEALRLATLALQTVGAPPVLGLVVSRIVYGARVFGMLSVLFGSLYALELQYQKFEVVVAVMLVFAFLLAFTVPFDAEVLLTNGLYRVSDEQALFVIYYGLLVLVGVNYGISLFRGRAILVPAALFLLMAGREALVFALSPAILIAGAAACLGGIIVLYKGFESNYSLT